MFCRSLLTRTNKTALQRFTAQRRFGGHSNDHHGAPAQVPQTDPVLDKTGSQLHHPTSAFPFSLKFWGPAIILTATVATFYYQKSADPDRFYNPKVLTSHYEATQGLRDDQGLLIKKPFAQY